MALCAALGCAVAGQHKTVAAESKQNGPTVDLQTMLEKGLRVKRPADVQFIATVVSRVQAGTLPESMVKSSFLWARNKRPHPFVYFQRALREQAKRRGIAI